MGRDAGSISRFTSTGKGGRSWDGKIMPRKEEEICGNRAAGLSGSHGGRRVARLVALALIVAIILDTVESASIEGESKYCGSLCCRLQHIH
ncbi:expressed unknown protein [Ectocarpus siliculosus]|uniref:Uncharacterized protein n=1 Tax=Ectocarpus siliculosus TaxID=2880 RepID=D7G966_ECTSI|nr:expressed unknown protein [Ectocarpus siliculosus]|eukprot:CBJ28230.1 expressed unknown protein [Ectocarpus siliculosus]